MIDTAAPREVFYDADRPLVADKDFMQWFGELEDVITAFAKKIGEHPYGLPLARSTGIACWHQYYLDDYTPQRAFNEDRTYWE